MTKKVKPIELTMDMILKMTPEVFRDTVKGQDLGFRMSLKNLLKMQFEQCNILKDTLLNSLSSGKVPEEDIKKHEDTIQELYLCMQLIEDRHNILDELTKESGSVKH